MLAQQAEPSSVPLPSEAVNTLTDGGARVLPMPSGEGTSQATEVPSSSPIVIILEEALAPPSNVP